MLRALQVVATEAIGEEPLMLTVLGHPVVRTPEAYGVFVRTRELGDAVFSLPRAVLQRLITDLLELSLSPPALQTYQPEAAQARGKTDLVKLSYVGSAQRGSNTNFCRIVDSVGPY